MGAVLAHTALGAVNETPTAPHGHGLVEIYERCGCDPDDDGFPPTHLVIADVGMTCARGLLYLVCADCCCGDNQQRCEDTHLHDLGRPPCPLGQPLFPAETNGRKVPTP